MEVLEMMWMMFKIALVFALGAVCCRMVLVGLHKLLEWDEEDR